MADTSVGLIAIAPPDGPAANGSPYDGGTLIEATGALREGIEGELKHDPTSEDGPVTGPGLTAGRGPMADTMLASMPPERGSLIAGMLQGIALPVTPDRSGPEFPRSDDDTTGAAAASAAYTKATGGPESVARPTLSSESQGLSIESARSASTDAAQRDGTGRQMAPLGSHFEGVLDENTEVALSSSSLDVPLEGGTDSFRVTTVSFDGGQWDPRGSVALSDPLATGGGSIAEGIVALKRSAAGDVAVRLEDLVGLLERRMERPLFVWLKSSSSASKYVTFDTLRSAGICVDYDPAINHVVLSAPQSKSCDSSH